MEEGELYAIETFATTGKGSVKDKLPVSHYMIDMYSKNKIKSANAKALYKYIDQHYSTLAFNPRWIEEESGLTNIENNLKYLVNGNYITPYPQLVDKEGSYVSQYEHSIMLRPTCKEVFTKGDDY